MSYTDVMMVDNIGGLLFDFFTLIFFSNIVGIVLCSHILGNVWKIVEYFYVLDITIKINTLSNIVLSLFISILNQGLT